MTISDDLTLVAELAIGLAGFSGLVAIVGNRQGRDTPQLDSARLRAALEFSLLVAGFALLPSLPREAGISQPAMWQFCCAFFAASGAGFTLFKLRSLRSLPGVTFSSPWYLFWISLSASAVLVLAAAAFGLGSPTFAYLWALYVYLTIAALTFLRLVLSLLDGTT